jgi:ArsR family transcriptional regulator
MPKTDLPESPPRLTQAQTQMLADMFRLLGEPNRLAIVLSCLSASLASHHLRLLRAARLLRGDRRGKQVFYTAADDHVRCVVTDLANHALEPRHTLEE